MHAVPKNDDRQHASWRNVFALDLRSLVVFRILAGLTVLADLIYRLPTLTQLYTDNGYMTSQLTGQYYQHLCGDTWHYAAWSLYWICGDGWWHYTLFGLTAVFAIMLTLGYRTRLATIGVWALLASLHTANPLVITSGDSIFRLAIFWSIFLPLGRIWSIDSIRTKSRNHENSDSNKLTSTGRTVLSMASACFIAQVIIMYFFTGVAKCNEDWFSGEAMQYVFRLNIYVHPLGKALLQYPILLKLTAYATLFAEVILIWCLLIPWKNAMWRAIVMLTFISFHIGIMLTMDIGLFSIICISIWTAFLPSRFWNIFPSKLNTESTPQFISDVYTIRPNRQTVFSNVVNKAIPVFCALALTFTILLNLANIERPGFKKLLPRSILPVGFLLSLDQKFQMFGHPPRHTPWFVYEATLANGKFVNPIQPPPITQVRNADELHQPPQNYLTILPTFHWRKLHRNLVNPNLKPYRAALAEYAVRRWNAEHGESEQMVHLKIYCYLESTDRRDADSFGQSTVWAVYGDNQKANKAVEAKVDSILEQLLEEENPDSPPF